eukprot:gene13123-15495_t
MDDKGWYHMVSSILKRYRYRMVNGIIHRMDLFEVLYATQRSLSATTNFLRRKVRPALRKARCTAAEGDENGNGNGNGTAEKKPKVLASYDEGDEASPAFELKPEYVKPDTPILDQINYPADMKKLKISDLIQLSADIRADLVSTISQTGGHFGSALGVVELTVALHHVFDTPEDKIIFDVGHQCYPHKILTGRRSRMSTIRQGGGLSGFTKRKESVYDCFGAGHSSTSISAAQGMAVAFELDGKKDRTAIAVIGDGAITGGMAYEAMNMAGYEDTNMIVVLNDNGQVSLPTIGDSVRQEPVGALSRNVSAFNVSVAKTFGTKQYRTLRENVKSFSKALPTPAQSFLKHFEEYTRTSLSGENGAMFFEELGMYYVGPVDGHDMEVLVPLLKSLKNNDGTKAKGPVLLHVITDKGRGFNPAMAADDKMHGVGKFDPLTGVQFKSSGGPPSYTSVFADALIAEANEDPKIMAITAAMGGGTGVGKFAKVHPDKARDVGIAEQHAVTFAAGLAAEGYKPFCAIYSTFLQRGYDQIVHDVALQNLPVRFAMDRAGLVGADGSTHVGAFDIPYLCCLPNMVVAAPSDELELMNIVATAAAYDDGPFAFRYPRGNGIGLDLPAKGKELPIGLGRTIQKGSKIAILSLGTRMTECQGAARLIEDVSGISPTIADARWAKPMDTILIKELVANHDYLVTVEEGSNGGFGSYVATYLCEEQLIGGKSNLTFKAFTLPDVFQDQAAQFEQYNDAGLNGPQIAEACLKLMGVECGAEFCEAVLNAKGSGPTLPAAPEIA